MASVLPTTIGRTGASCVGSSGATDRRAFRVLLTRRGGPSGLATPIFSFSLSLLEPKSLRMIILTIILVQVLCCHSITKITRNGINGAIFVTPCLGGRFLLRGKLELRPFQSWCIERCCTGRAVYLGINGKRQHIGLECSWS